MRTKQDIWNIFSLQQREELAIIYTRKIIRVVKSGNYKPYL